MYDNDAKSDGRAISRSVPKELAPDRPERTLETLERRLRQHTGELKAARDRLRAVAGRMQGTDAGGEAGGAIAHAPITGSFPAVFSLIDDAEKLANDMHAMASHYEGL